MRKRVFLLLSIAWAVAIAAEQPDPLSTLRRFEGKWEGAALGAPGKGVSTREYRFELNGRFLMARNRSVYEPKSPNAKPEVHEDLSLFSFDGGLKKIILRQFHAEGFVNEYTAAPSTADGTSLEFITVRIENIPPGWRAKESYRFVSADEIVETFSLAAPGKEVEVYSQTRLRRVKTP